MLEELTVENIAIIDRAALPLGPGFTVLTGETGAGKSLLVDAIGLALGGRADSDLVRHGAAKGVVTITVRVQERAELLEECAKRGVDLEDGRLLVQREVGAEGRSSVRLNGRTAPLSTLRGLGDLLVDLHGQHDHQSLLNPDRQLDFLDDWIGLEALALREEVAQRLAEFEACRRKLATAQSSRRDREQRLDLLRFQVAEIQAAAPKPHEGESLQKSLVRLQNAERLRAVAASALERLSEQEGSAIESVGESAKELQPLVELDASLSPIVESLVQSQLLLEEAIRGLSDYDDAVEGDPVALEETAARLDLLQRLRRKYGDDEQEVLAYLARAESELDSLQNEDASEEQLALELAAAKDRLDELAASLTRLRTAKAGEFARQVQAELVDLAMDKASFDVRLSPKPVEPDGADRAEFVFSANPGEPTRALSKVASGGELSRVMLAIKVASAGRAGVPTLIFDEVDSGLSGRAAAVTAKKLSQLALHYQVIAISHLPQIAGRANCHFRIEKVEESGRVVTRLRLLEAEQRVAEIARLLAGEQVGPSALANARELLAAEA